MEHKLPKDLHDFIKEVNTEIEKKEQYYLKGTQPSEDQFLLFAETQKELDNVKL